LGADTLVIALEGVALEHASCRWVAAVAGAGVAIDTSKRVLARLATAIHARVAQGTGVAIDARRLIVRMGASRLRVASVVGAGVVIVAPKGSLGYAASVLADISGGAGIAILAVEGVILKHAPGRRVTAVVGAGIAVGAGESVLTRLAITIHAGVAQGAGVAIDASRLVVHVGASGGGIAPIVRARVVIVAHKGSLGYAASVLADISGRTGVAIVALPGVGGKDAVTGFADFVRAGVPVVAGKHNAALAASFLAHVIDGAGVAIVARTKGILVAATATGKADIHGTRVVVVAFQRTRADACSFGAGIRGRAGILVVAVLTVGTKNTP
jgi:hypothetical protein